MWAVFVLFFFPSNVWIKPFVIVGKQQRDAVWSAAQFDIHVTVHRTPCHRVTMRTCVNETDVHAAVRRPQKPHNRLVNQAACVSYVLFFLSYVVASPWCFK